jgi:hypothetical protein
MDIRLRAPQGSFGKPAEMKKNATTLPPGTLEFGLEWT